MNSQISIQSKLPQSGTSIFAVMTALAKETGAINLSQGFPDFPIDSRLIELVSAAMRKGYNQYAPMPGLAELRNAISKKIEHTSGLSYHSDTEITVVAGATQGLFDIFTACIQEGDEVIFFEPAYDSYLPCIRLNKGVPRPIALEYPSYQIPWDLVRKQINAKTKMIVINTPHNPTGTVLAQEDLLQLQEITRGTDIIVLSDEVYEHLIFDNHTHQSVCLYPELAERSYVVASFGKTFHATGWKMGYVLAPEKLMSEFRKIHQFNIFTVNTPIQFAIAEYMQDPGTYQQLSSFYQRKRDFFLEQIKKSRFRPLSCKGTYFLLLDYSNISSEKELDFAKRLTTEYGLASVPVSPFYSDSVENKVIRVCFAKEEETLRRAAELINRI